MRADDWQMLYEQLIRERDAAKALRDGARIDRIATDLMHLEHSRYTCHAVQVMGSAPQSHPLDNSSVRK